MRYSCCSESARDSTIYATAIGVEQSAIGEMALALLGLRNRLLVVAGVLVSLAVISFGREPLRSSECPDWTGIWGYAAGITDVIRRTFPLFAPLFIVRSLGGFLVVV